MYDLALTGGTVVDGTGAPAFGADLAVTDGRIVAVGSLDEPAARTIDVGGAVVAPGFVDPHTHYDAQLLWDPLATPSSWHGVTTVIGGNCGFTLAPLAATDAEFTRRMMAQVEGMPLAALDAGAAWDWRSFADYLTVLDGRTAVNAGFLVGHCALRRHVLGPAASERASTPDEVAAIVALTHECLDAGALGLSTSRSSTHADADGAPVPSRLAERDEVLALCEATGEHPGTSLEAIVEGCLGRFSADEVDLLAGMSAVAGRPLNWNVLSVAAADPDRAEHQLAPSRRARELGGRVVALTMPVPAVMNMSFGTFCALWLLPGWRDVLDVPVPERIARLSDPATRARMLEMAATSESLARLVEFERYEIGTDALSEANATVRGRLVGEIAAERGQDPFTCLAEIVANDELRTVLWPRPADDTDADWAVRRRLWDDPDVLLGGSDAGAHLDRMLGASYPTRFLADCQRGRRLVSLERAVQLMTDVPARLFGLVGRGRVAPGRQADLVVFDPASVGAGPARVVADLPGGASRLVADPVGVELVIVNGVVTVERGRVTGELPGVVLRSGRHTAATDTRASTLEDP